MRTLIILFLLFATRVVGQTHNEEILKYVNDNLGKKIGKGLCFELVQASVRTYSPDFKMGYDNQDKIHFGKPIKRSKIQPGDIMIMTGGTKRTASHVSIIYKIDGDKIYVAEQNTKGKLKESIVVINLLNEEWHMEYYGKIDYHFYHPK